MTGLEYEHAVAKYLKSHGYSNVVVTQGSGDYGVDITAHKGKHKYAVQCKYYTGSVGLEAVQQAVAGMAMYNCDRAMVVTNSTYTRAAEELAKSNNVVLLAGITPLKSNFSFLKTIIIVLVAIILFVFAAGISSAINAIKIQFQQQQYGFAIINTLSMIALVAFPFAAYFGGKKLFIYITNKRKATNKKSSFHQTEYRQTGNHNHDLKVSPITGMPHLFTIEGVKYNIDNVDEIKRIPFSYIEHRKISINEKEYTICDYFTECAEQYEKQGYNEVAKALREKTTRKPEYHHYEYKRLDTKLFDYNNAKRFFNNIKIEQPIKYDMYLNILTHSLTADGIPIYKVQQLCNDSISVSNEMILNLAELGLIKEFGIRTFKIAVSKETFYILLNELND